MNNKCKKCNMYLPLVKGLICNHPCGHFTHPGCYPENYTVCPICENECIPVSRDTPRFDKFKQEKIDLDTLTNISPVRRSLVLLIYRSIYFLIYYLYYYFYTNNMYDFLLSCRKLFNVNIKIHNKDKLYECDNIVYALTHHSFYDFLVVGILLCKHRFVGFVTNEIIKKTPIYWFVKDKPILFVNSKKKNDNTVKKMSDFLKKNGSLIVFPQGFLSWGSIPKFKSGAFVLEGEYKLQPIVLKYSENVTRFSIFDILSNVNSVNVDIFILNTVQLNNKNNTSEIIEKIRQDMHLESGMDLSRVSN